MGKSIQLARSFSPPFDNIVDFLGLPSLTLHRGGGGFTVQKLLLKQNVPLRILKLDQLQIEVDHLLEPETICFIIKRKITGPIECEWHPCNMIEGYYGDWIQNQQLRVSLKLNFPTNKTAALANTDWFSVERSASSNFLQDGVSQEERDLPDRKRHEINSRTKIGQCVACSNPRNSHESENRPAFHLRFSSFLLAGNGIDPLRNWSNNRSNIGSQDMDLRVWNKNNEEEDSSCFVISRRH
ncbi:hypothetical protein Tco_1418381 [Tanacetum coccineum]